MYIEEIFYQALPALREGVVTVFALIGIAYTATQAYRVLNKNRT
jgi:hypothetical protein